MTSGEWSRADFTAPESGEWPPEWDEYAFWMGRIGKQPYAPWARPDHPDVDDEKDARFSSFDKFGVARLR